MSKILSIILFVVVGCRVQAQTILYHQDYLSIKTLNFSNDGKLFGHTHLHPYELRILAVDSTWGVNISSRLGSLKCFDFSSDAIRVAVGTHQGGIEIFHIASRRSLYSLKVSDSQINDVKFSADGKLLANCRADGTIHVIDTDTFNPVMSVRMEQAVNCVEFSKVNPDHLIAGDHSGTISEWDIQTGKLIRKFKAHDSFVLDIALPDSSLMVTASHDETIRIWDFRTFGEMQVLKGHSRAVYSIDTFLALGLIASASFDKTVRLWDINSGKEKQILEGHTDIVNVVRFSRDGQVLSGSRDYTLRLWQK